MLSLAGAPALAQTNPRYIRFSGVPGSVKGALYAPDAAQKACRDSRHPSAGEIFDLTVQPEVNQELEAK